MYQSSLQTTLSSSSIRPHLQAPDPHCEYSLAAELPATRENRRRNTISRCYFFKHYRPNAAPKGRKAYFSGSRGLLIGLLAVFPPYREGSEMF